MNHFPELMAGPTLDRISAAPITPAEQEQARAEAAESRRRTLERQRAEQEAAAIAADVERISEWLRRHDELDARPPIAETEQGREAVHRFLVRHAIARNDLVLAGFVPEKK